ncbi:MAG TPA: hypothetical protein VFU86_23480 [Terriglobales bacterium]|nr:hypothetical protein [Terriglobales bacterium]
MKRGGFWVTTVAAGVAVLGLMTMGRAGLKSQTALFLQGQMKIAAGDTDSGLRLLTEASSHPQPGSLRAPLENASQEVKAGVPGKPCRKWTISLPNTATGRRMSGREQVSVKIPPAPEPTLASLVAPAIPAPPMVRVSYAQDAMAYIPAAQRVQFRAHRVEFERAQRIREIELKKVARQVSGKYGIPDAHELQVQVQRELGTLAQ